MLMTTPFPATALTQLNRELGRLFDDFAAGAPFDRPFPALNLWEDGARLIAEAEVPGHRMQDLEVLVVGDELTIKGRRSADAPEGATVHRRERGMGEFHRTLTLPVEINADAVEATLKDGVLTLVLPKAEAARARKITVRSA
jgi:HSP20 family protein